MNKLIYYIIGYYSVKITGNNLKRLFKICINKNITFKKLLVSEDCIFAEISPGEYNLLSELCKKTGVKLEVIKKYGLPYKILYLTGHLYYVFLFFIIVLIFKYFNTRILSINISGNSYLSNESIINQLSNSGISLYSNITEIDCSVIESILIDNNNFVKWCSAYTKGNDLYILLDEELTDNNSDSEINGYYSNVYGRIKSIYVRSGVATVKAGDEVKPGDMLISSEVPVTNTYGEVLETRSVIPDGEVTIQFQAIVNEIQPFSTTKRIYEKAKKGYELSVSGYKLFSYLPSISVETCDIITENKNLSVSDFVLPVTITKKQVRQFNIQSLILSPEEAENLLYDKYDKIMKSYYDAGYTIINEKQTINETENCLMMEVSLQVEGPAYSCK